MTKRPTIFIDHTWHHFPAKTKPYSFLQREWLAHFPNNLTSDVESSARNPLENDDEIFLWDTLHEEALPVLQESFDEVQKRFEQY